MAEPKVAQSLSARQRVNPAWLARIRGRCPGTQAPISPQVSGANSPVISSALAQRHWILRTANGPREKLLEVVGAEPVAKRKITNNEQIQQRFKEGKKQSKIEGDH